MSAVALLLENAIDYERTHQVVLAALLKESKPLAALFGAEPDEHLEWEPEKQLFDLAVRGGGCRIFLELKMWSSWTEAQRIRQANFLESSGSSGAYVLLGTSWFEHSALQVRQHTHGRASRIGYEELIAGLDAASADREASAALRGLAQAYRDSLAEQFSRLTNAAFEDAHNPKHYHYSLYWHLQKHLEHETAIYTVNNAGGPVFILNARPWLPVRWGDQKLELYFEVVGDRLCIKFHPATEDRNEKLALREIVRRAIHSELGSTLQVRNKGRLGKYMTACQIAHDFSNVSTLQASARVFAAVGKALPRIADKIAQRAG